jgi:hypothetical protein
MVNQNAFWYFNRKFKKIPNNINFVVIDMNEYKSRLLEGKAFLQGQH